MHVAVLVEDGNNWRCFAKHIADITGKPVLKLSNRTFETAYGVKYHLIKSAPGARSIAFADCLVLKNPERIPTGLIEHLNRRVIMTNYFGFTI